MSFVSNIKLKNYRNFQYFENDFDNNCNVIYGKNGSGKTNILESISLFDRGTGFRNDKLIDIVKNKEENFEILGTFFSSKQSYDLKIFTNNTNSKLRKNILINNDGDKKTLAHVRALLSLIIYQPEMERLFLLTPSIRRRFIDRFIYSYNKSYNQLINKYKKLIIERSNLLQNSVLDQEWISNIEENIAISGSQIYKNRIEQINILNQKLQNFFLTKKSPFEVKIKLIDKLLEDDPEIFNNTSSYLELLRNSRKIDSIVGGASIGPHKSDFNGIVNNDFPLNQLSTGQQKTIVLLLILSQCEFLVTDCSIFPIVLLDEICSHLDDTNRSILLDLFSKFNLQFIMTGTDKSLFSFLSTNSKYYNISK